MKHDRFVKALGSCKRPVIVPDAVEGEEDGDGAVDGDGEGEEEEPGAVPEADAVVDVGAVVVELRHAAVADAAVLGAQRAHHAARVAQPQDEVAVLPQLPLPLVAVRDLLDRPERMMYVPSSVSESWLRIWTRARPLRHSRLVEKFVGLT